MFNPLIGNLSVKYTLRHMLDRGRVPASLLLAGPDGIGKKQFVLELTKAMLCGDGGQDGPCGSCSVCSRIDAFAPPDEENREAYKRVLFTAHPDVGIVAAAGRNILVDAIRHLESEANFRPYEASERFFIIDNADRMNEAASNALLKTLEEPPPGVHLFLVTSRPDTLLPTIRSRCQTVRFGPVPSEEIEQFLINERAFSHDEAKLAARMAGGSVARALAADLARLRDTRERLIELVRHALVGDTAKLLRLSEELTDAKNKDSLEQVLEILETLLYDIWRVRATGEAATAQNADLADEISKLATDPRAAFIEDWLTGIAEFRLNLNVNVNKRIALDALFVRMTQYN